MSLALPLPLINPIPYIVIFLLIFVSFSITTVIVIIFNDSARFLFATHNQATPNMLSKPGSLLLFLSSFTALALAAPPSPASPQQTGPLTCAGQAVISQWKPFLYPANDCFAVIATFRGSVTNPLTPVEWPSRPASDHSTTTPNSLLGNTTLPQLVGNQACLIKFDFVSGAPPNVTLQAAVDSLAAAAILIVTECIVSGVGQGGAYNPINITSHDPNAETYPTLGVKVTIEAGNLLPTSYAQTVPRFIHT